MRSFLNAILPLAFFCSCLPAAQRAVAAGERRTDNTAFYQVPMVCPAARDIGCGPLAKPVLLDLEKAPAVEEAWLDQKGQVLAVVWMSCSAPTDRTETLTAISTAHAISMTELSGSARQTALQSFRANEGWHRGAEVDRLSTEEARVIADRLLQRVVAETPTARTKVESIRPLLTDRTRQLLIETDLSDVARGEYREKLLAEVGQHLNAQELAALRAAIGRGFRPIGDEQ